MSKPPTVSPVQGSAKKGGESAIPDALSHLAQAASTSPARSQRPLLIRTSSFNHELPIMART